MSTASRQGRAYRREEIEQLLREALAGLMADGTPFRDLSVGRLIDAAGMARSTFYKYFEDKPAMLEALSAGTLGRLYAAQRRWLDAGPAAGPDDVRRGMRTLLDSYLAEEAVMRAVAEASVYEPRIQAAYVSAVEDYARAIGRFVRAGQKSGRIRPAVHPRDTGDALAWMIERSTTRLAPGATPRRLDAIAGTLADVVCATLFGERAA